MFINILFGTLKLLTEVVKTWIKHGICLVYYILWFKIIDIQNLSHEWLHDFMCIILNFYFFNFNHFLISLLIGAHEVSNRSPLRFFMWIIFNHSIKYTRQMPSLIQVFCYFLIGRLRVGGGGKPPWPLKKITQKYFRNTEIMKPKKN